MSTHTRKALALTALLGIVAFSPSVRADGLPSSEKETRPQKNYVRALEELVAFNGLLGIPWYWENKDYSERNWQIRWDWSSWKRKAITFDAVRMDGDDFKTNAVHHTFVAGMTDYVIGRANHLTIPEAFLMGTLASVAWEYLVEFDQPPSLNDMITTPLSGIALGEVFHRMGQYFLRGSDQPVNWLLGSTIGALQTFHARADNLQQPRSAETGDLGFALDPWHRFETSAGIAQAWIDGRTEARMQLGLDTEIVTIPSWEREGKTSAWVSEQNFTSMTSRLAFHEGGIQELFLRARATIGGHYHQDLRGRRNALFGHAMYSGAIASFEFSRQHLFSFYDSLGIVGIFGATSDLTLHAGSFRMRAVLDASPDFGMITALAGPAYLESLGRDALTKNTLQAFGYYYALGVSVAPSLVLEYAPLSLSLDARFDTFRSIQGFDRRQDELTDDSTLYDRRISYRALASVSPFPLLKFSVGVEERIREGAARDVRATLRERLWTARASFVL